MKTEIDYESFCVKVEQAVEAANAHIAQEGDPSDMGDCYRYEIARLEEGGLFHICLMRVAGVKSPTFDLARVLMTVFYPDMTKDEFMALAGHVVSGRTKIEEFDALPIHILYECFCTRPE